MITSTNNITMTTPTAPTTAAIRVISFVLGTGGGGGGVLDGTAEDKGEMVDVTVGMSVIVAFEEDGVSCSVLDGSKSIIVLLCTGDTDDTPVKLYTKTVPRLYNISREQCIA